MDPQMLMQMLQGMDPQMLMSLMGGQGQPMGVPGAPPGGLGGMLGPSF